LVHKAMRCLLSYAWIRLAFSCSRQPTGMACGPEEIRTVSRFFGPRDSPTFRCATRTTIGINRIRIAATLANLKAARFRGFRVAHSYLPVVDGERSLHSSRAIAITHSPPEISYPSQSHYEAACNILLQNSQSRGHLPQTPQALKRR